MNRRSILFLGGAAILGAAGCTGMPTATRQPGPSDILNASWYQPSNPEQGPHLVAFTERAQYGINPGDILVSTQHRALIHQLDATQAMLYPVGVGSEGRQWTGVEYVTRKAVWPRWTPTASMIARNPALYGPHRNGMPGGPDNPLGARALYLGDTYYRIHGTNDANRVGRFVSNGCINMHNDHVVHLYDRVPVGARVVVV